jgi:dephospho-CoA kinase
MKRDNISLEQARAWLTLQMPEEEKRQRADIIIYNE